jgi:energy-coupling factor transporter ATP-binding protein EcfA2
MFFSFFLFNPLQELGNVIATYNETKASMENFSKLMNSNSEAIPSNPKTIGLITNLRFSNISFKHQTAKSYAVKNISFEAHAGETIAFVGPSGSGKTNFLLTLLHLFSQGKGTFLDITVVTRNADEPLYNFLKSKCDQIQIKEGMSAIPLLDKMDKKANHLVCFDDLILAKDQTPIINYYIRARKLNCSVVYLSQSFFDIPPIIRKNCSYMVFLKIGGLREIKTILRDFSLDCTKEQLVSMYDYATAEKLSPFIIDIEEKDRNHKFRKGFNEYLNPSQYGADEN